MTTDYTYNIDTDFGSITGNDINLNELNRIITDNVTIVKVLQFLTQYGRNVVFRFNSALSVGESTELDTIVDTYIKGNDVIDETISGGSIIINVIKDVKPNGTRGGTFSSKSANNGDPDDDDDNKDANGNTTWKNRDLNTVKDAGVIICSVSNNIITLQSGIYYINASAPAYNVESHQIRLYNVTSSNVIAVGTSEYTKNVQTRSYLSTFITIINTTKIKLQHRAGKTRNNDGFGRAGGFGEDETYAIVEISKVQ